MHAAAERIEFGQQLACSDLRRLSQPALLVPSRRPLRLIQRRRTPPGWHAAHGPRAAACARRRAAPCAPARWRTPRRPASLKSPPGWGEGRLWWAEGARWGVAAVENAASILQAPREPPALPRPPARPPRWTPVGAASRPPAQQLTWACFKVPLQGSHSVHCTASTPATCPASHPPTCSNLGLPRSATAALTLGSLRDWARRDLAFLQRGTERWAHAAEVPPSAGSRLAAHFARLARERAAAEHLAQLAVGTLAFGVLPTALARRGAAAFGSGSGV